PGSRGQLRLLGRPGASRSRGDAARIPGSERAVAPVCAGDLRRLYRRLPGDLGLERLGRAEARARIRADLAREGLTNFGRIPAWDVVRVAIAPNQPQDAGRTLGEIARRRRVDPLDAVCDFLIADRGATRILITSMSEKDVHEISGTPWVLVGSDANALATSGVTSQGKPHPRSYGRTLACSAPSSATCRPPCTRRRARQRRRSDLPIAACCER